MSLNRLCGTGTHVASASTQATTPSKSSSNSSANRSGSRKPASRQSFVSRSHRCLMEFFDHLSRGVSLLWELPLPRS